jgi:hypothetical protein
MQLVDNSARHLSTRKAYMLTRRPQFKVIFLVATLNDHAMQLVEGENFAFLGTNIPDGSPQVSPPTVLKRTPAKRGMLRWAILE